MSQSHTMVQGAENELFWLKIQYPLLFSIHAFVICIYFSVTTSINVLSVNRACPVSLQCCQSPDSSHHSESVMSFPTPPPPRLVLTLHISHFTHFDMCSDFQKCNLPCNESPVYIKLFSLL